MVSETTVSIYKINQIFRVLQVKHKKVYVKTMHIYIFMDIN